MGVYLPIYTNYPRVLIYNQSAMPTQYIPARTPYSSRFQALPAQVQSIRAAFASARPNDTPTSMQIEAAGGGNAGNNGTGSGVTLLKYTQFLINTGAANVPVLLFPRNRQRRAFSIANATGAVIFVSYGSPKSPLAPGIPVPNDTGYEKDQGEVSLDDIYVTSGTANVTILGFEGTISTSALQV